MPNDAERILTYIAGTLCMNKSSKRYLDALAEAVKALDDSRYVADDCANKPINDALARIAKKLWENDG